MLSFLIKWFGSFLAKELRSNEMYRILSPGLYALTTWQSETYGEGDVIGQQLWNPANLTNTDNRMYNYVER